MLYTHLIRNLNVDYMQNLITRNDSTFCCCHIYLRLQSRVPRIYGVNFNLRKQFFIFRHSPGKRDRGNVSKVKSKAVYFEWLHRTGRCPKLFGILVRVLDLQVTLTSESEIQARLCAVSVKMMSPKLVERQLHVDILLMETEHKDRKHLENFWWNAFILTLTIIKDVCNPKIHYVRKNRR